MCAGICSRSTPDSVEQKKNISRHLAMSMAIQKEVNVHGGATGSLHWQIVLEEGLSACLDFHAPMAFRAPLGLFFLNIIRHLLCSPNSPVTCELVWFQTISYAPSPSLSITHHRVSRIGVRIFSAVDSGFIIIFSISCFQSPGHVVFPFPPSLSVLL